MKGERDVSIVYSVQPDKEVKAVCFIISRKLKKYHIFKKYTTLKRFHESFDFWHGIPSDYKFLLYKGSFPFFTTY